MFRPALLCLFTLLPLAAQPTPGSGWWMTEPLRWLQTNLREPDAATDPLALVQQASAFHANVLHLNMGGIAATYPTRVEFHYASPQLPPGTDFFGAALRAAHARHIRVVGRFDFSKTRKEVFDAHPEWFFRQAGGAPVIYNGLYSTCINSGWYREHAPKILTEALTRYDVDGLFFNMFGNQSSDYSGKSLGHCHCQACQRKFQKMFSRPLSENAADPDYRRFMALSAQEVAADFGRIIHQLRPLAGYFNYLDESTDGIMSESNTGVTRPLPLWPYTSSANVNRARNSQPAKMSINLCMQFVDYAWRFATVPAGEIALRLWQNIAHGGALAFAINGTFDQQDRQAVETARPIFAWAAANETLLHSQQSAARVILLSSGDQSSYRGLFRFLSEEHIPFAVASNLEWIGKRPVDLVLTPGPMPAGLEPYLAAGGRVLSVGARPGSPAVQGYVRVRDTTRFPSLSLTTLLLLDGPFTESAAQPGAPLTLVPPSMFGPPEKIHIDIRDTATPALLASHEGRALWLPWELGALYYRLSLPAHAALLRDLVHELLPHRQLETSAHPLVEISLMQQNGHTLIHLINLSGHSQTAYFPPIPMRDIRIVLDGNFVSARLHRVPATLPIGTAGSRTSLTLPELRDYEMIELTRAAPSTVRK
ncbi:MAG TPA: hypothetical protein VGK29_09175 [Paludibaculum sp.]|jgi:hypothetical protein